MKFKTEDLNLPFDIEHLDCFEEQLNFKRTLFVDTFIEALVYPYYLSVKNTFYKECLEAIPDISNYLERHQNFDVYILYHGKALFVDPVKSHSYVECISYPVDENLPCAKKLYNQLVKIEADLNYLCLWSRPSFKQNYLVKEHAFNLELQKYISPMLLKSNSILSELLEDLKVFRRPEDSPVLQKAEDIMSFYVGFNLVCNI